MQALILEKLQQKLNSTKIYQIFDEIGGTSIGGIIALGLVVPNDSKDNVRLEVSDLVGLFEKEGERIFPPKKYPGLVDRVMNLKYTRYDATPLENLLQQYFKNITLKESLQNIIVTACTDDHRPFKFTRQDAQRNLANNFPLWQVGRATSAAPSYFTAFSPVAENGDRVYTFVDGGLWVNNPAEQVALALLEKPKFNRESSAILSLGTGNMPVVDPLPAEGGQIRSAAPTISALMTSRSREIDETMGQLFGKNYTRINPDLNSNIDLSDLAPDTLALLKNGAESNFGKIEDFCENNEVLRKKLEAL